MLLNLKFFILNINIKHPQIQVHICFLQFYLIFVGSYAIDFTDLFALNSSYLRFRITPHSFPPGPSIPQAGLQWERMLLFSVRDSQQPRRIEYQLPNDST